mmetsp:Transcript_4525/g.5124  ORF Transcript_4525/g.5124 Transcript_4525/m.5124 type:complete len:200 (-) Transcript_4525:86-685(-)|eukprot:CAMPEP_0170788292 /NCGR_PEP_ID=MMETSP0733-20121128/18852_1 /TAXON_ID=186038 /ORGANISM="Fragilariopsis kerguelensis, Strain L26-C5" /LENGTH=199 /DNA_ID=CAMNT_0011134783 /DNA_START=36 /DNA_END=635 /DNA_ORIENTATION=-
MKITILASIIVGSAAFAPSQQVVSSISSLAAESNVGYANEPGVIAPLGLYDPCSLLYGADQERFEHLREVELKHGRVSMLAVVGFLTTYAGVRLPGLEAVPTGFAAWKALPEEVVGQMGMALIVMEMANRDHTGSAEFPGDFRNNLLDFGWDEKNDAWKMKKRTTEINNGRAAMMGILGLMVHESMGNLNDILPAVAHR